jgi:hypothetical protein
MHRYLAQNGFDEAIILARNVEETDRLIRRLLKISLHPNYLKRDSRFS